MNFRSINEYFYLKNNIIIYKILKILADFRLVLIVNLKFYRYLSRNI